MSSSSRRIVRTTASALIAVGLATALVNGAQTKNVQAVLDKAHDDCWANLRATGGVAANTVQEIPEQPAPAVALLTAGGSVNVTFKRMFQRGSKFFIDVEGVTMSNPAAANGTFSATLTVPAPHGPGFIHVWALNPVDCKWDTVPVAFINTVYRFDLKSANGWTVRAVPSEKAFKIEEHQATLPYKIEFLRANETKPFESRPGNVRYYDTDNEKTQLEVTVFEDQSAQNELEEINKKMADPTLTDAQREALGQRMAKAMERMMKEIATDPVAAQKKEDDFGCVQIRLEPDAAGKVTGSLSCGKNVGKEGVLAVTGTMTLIK